MNKKEMDSDEILVSKTAMFTLLSSVTKVEAFHKEQEKVITTLKRQLKKAVRSKRAALAD